MSAADTIPANQPDDGTTGAKSSALNVSAERMKQLGPAWEAIERQIRAIDTVELGEIEPAVTYGWRRDEQ